MSAIATIKERNDMRRERERDVLEHMAIMNQKPNFSRWSLVFRSARVFDYR